MPDHIIHKFPLKVQDEQIITIPSKLDCTMLDVQAQRNGDLMLWVELEPGAPTYNVTILMFGTGLPVSDVDKVYIATVQADFHVWHVYRKVE